MTGRGKRLAAGTVLLAMALTGTAGCRADGARTPPDPGSSVVPDQEGLSTEHTAGPNEPGVEYWTPERMESAEAQMPTED